MSPDYGMSMATWNTGKRMRLDVFDPLRSFKVTFSIIYPMEKLKGPLVDYAKAIQNRLVIPFHLRFFRY